VTLPAHSPRARSTSHLGAAAAPQLRRRCAAAAPPLRRRCAAAATLCDAMRRRCSAALAAAPRAAGAAAAPERRPATSRPGRARAAWPQALPRDAAQAPQVAAQARKRRPAPECRAALLLVLLRLRQCPLLLLGAPSAVAALRAFNLIRVFTQPKARETDSRINTVDESNNAGVKIALINFELRLAAAVLPALRCAVAAVRTSGRY
jgi:hypothetical protein